MTEFKELKEVMEKYKVCIEVARQILDNIEKDKKSVNNH